MYTYTHIYICILLHYIYVYINATFFAKFEPYVQATNQYLSTNFAIGEGTKTYNGSIIDSNGNTIAQYGNIAATGTFEEVKKQVPDFVKQAILDGV